MGNQYKEHGGGAATGLADQLIGFLSQGLNTGTFGAGTAAGGDAVGSTQGIAGVLNDILSGGAGNVGGAMAQLIKDDTNSQVLNMRSRYGMSGGTAFGSGAQYGEGVLRSKQAPAITSAVGGLQMNAVQNLLGLIGQLSGKGIAQRQGVMQEDPWMTAAKVGMQGGAAVAAAMAGAPGADKVLLNAGQMSPATANAGGGGYGGVMAPTPITASMMPQFAPPQFVMASPTLFDYGIQ